MRFHQQQVICDPGICSKLRSDDGCHPCATSRHKAGFTEEPSILPTCLTFTLACILLSPTVRSSACVHLSGAIGPRGLLLLRRCVGCPQVNITGNTFLHNSGTYGGGLYLAANMTSRNRVLSSNFTANNATDSSGLGVHSARRLCC